MSEGLKTKLKLKLKANSSLSKQSFIIKFVDDCVEQIKELLGEHYSEHRLNSQLLNDVMNFVEESLANTKFKDVDKKELVKEIFSKIGVTTDEMVILEQMIQYMLDNHMVKKTSFLGKTLSCLDKALNQR